MAVWQRVCAVQSQIKRDELEQLERGDDNYSGRHIRQALVHTRQDMVLVVGMLLSIHQVLVVIAWLLGAITVILASRFW